MKFKIIFPSGYKVEDVYNDNIDVNIILENNDVYFSTLFTLENVSFLMNKDQSCSFWSDSMVIVKDLKRKTIAKAIEEIIYDDYLANSCTFIGVVDDIFGKKTSFQSIVDKENVLEVIFKNDGKGRN